MSLLSCLAPLKSALQGKLVILLLRRLRKPPRGALRLAVFIVVDVSQVLGSFFWWSFVCFLKFCLVVLWDKISNE